MTPLDPAAPHPLVGQLLHRAEASATEAPALDTWQTVLGLLSQMLHDADLERDKRGRSIELASRDMQRLYHDLQRKTEHERVEQEAIMRATLESAIEGIMVTDNARRVIAITSGSPRYRAYRRTRSRPTISARWWPLRCAS